LLHRKIFNTAAFFAIGALGLLTACSGTDANTGSAPTASEVADASEVALLSGSAKSNKADQKTGDLAPPNASQEVRGQWVQLRAASAGNLNPVVVDGAGRTLYRFDNDTAKPSKSNCNGDCAKTWPPVTVNKGGRVFISGLKKADVGFVAREDGTRQLTVGGWPVYRFNKDTKPGDTLGQGVGGTWFGVTPNGQKASVPASPVAPPTVAPPAADPAAKPATSVVLFSGKNFDDFSGDNFSTSVQGPGCKDVRGTFLSVAPGGSVKLWSEPGCKGTSLVITDDLRDVTTAGFPAGPKSLLFG
jgi:predicted lipoprotein with Yx(FWY)xxD motif